MNIHYKIVSINQEDHSFIVRYWTDIISEDFLANEFDENNEIKRREDGSPTRCRSDVNLTLYKVDATEVEIDLLIRENAPKEWLETLEKVQDPKIDTSMEKLNKKIGVVKIFESVTPEQTFATLDEALANYSIEP